MNEFCISNCEKSLKMPITISDVKWEETLEFISLYLPSKSVKKENVTVTQFQCYLKVSYPPYIYEIILYKPVNPHYKITISDGYIMLNFQKENFEIWNQLHVLPVNKEEMRLYRNTAIEKTREILNEIETKKKEVKRSNEKYSLNEMINLENADQKRIKDVKESERLKAVEQLESWKIQQNEKEQLEKSEIKDIYNKYMNEESEKCLENELFEDVQNNYEIRNSGHIAVSFTPRVFPTPERESTKPLEEEWLKTQADRRKLADVHNEELKEEEKDPVYLRDKGNALFSAGNYQAAVNAYSHAINMKSEMHSLFSNRAACHLKLGNYFKALEDSSRAIELLQPPVAQNLQARVRAHLRRGYALVNLSMLRKGFVEISEAAKLDPSNESIKQDLDRLQHAIEDEHMDEEDFSADKQYDS